MIKIQDIQPADILPEGLRDDIGAQGIAYAVCQQIKKWCVFNDGIMIYYTLASLPDEVLDLMAAEYRTPAYSTKYSTDVKRMLIADTMLYYMKLGTPMAVRRIVTSIFQSGTVQEWFEYGGEPHHFRINISNPNVGPEDLNEFVRQLRSVKRLSSWLDSISSQLDIKASEIGVGFWVHTGDYITLNPMIIEDVSRQISGNTYAGIGMATIDHVTVPAE